MRSIFCYLFSLVLALAVVSPGALSQNRAFTDPNENYALELPSTAWRAITDSDSAHQHTEFVNGDRTEGYLRIRKEVVDAGTSALDVAHRDQDQKLRFQPGYVEGKDDTFDGRLKGIVSTYEYTNAGKNMMGIIYYLQADNRTFYALQFTGLRAKLERIRNQTDFIARSFHTK